MKTVLIIEDEPELVKVLSSYLEKENFSVLKAYRGDTGFKLWDRERPDLVLLDLNLPGMNGLNVARKIRRQANTPIIMVTARVEEMDQLIGLELGADDYVTKPFSPRVVVAKVRAVLRRADTSQNQTQILQRGDLKISLEDHRVTQAEIVVDLTPTEFNLLYTMANHPGRVFSRLQLLESTQGAAYQEYERTIDAHIKNLRSKIEKDPKDPQYIETVFGVGYRFAHSLGQ